MNLALIGYGKMGKAIESIALNHQYNILLKTKNYPSYKEIKNVEISIEFSQPESTLTNIKICLEENITIISGTTGWLLKNKKIKNICLIKSGTFLYASNFSIGVNLFFEINKKFAKLINRYKKKYNIEIEEIHHINKIDMPSGTAIKIAKEITHQWDLNNKQLSIISKRFKQIAGIHIIKYQSIIENIIFKHTALAREGFAIGVIIAAEWVFYKKGFFSMNDVLRI